MATLLALNPDVKITLDSFRERITGEAEELVAHFFPKKFLELDAFLRDPMLNLHDLTQIHSDVSLPAPILLGPSSPTGPGLKQRKPEGPLQGPKVSLVPHGMLKSNQQLVDILEKVKPEIRLLMEKCNVVRLWVQLSIPKIEGGNSFGVSIQEDTVAELQTVESEAMLHLDEIARYYNARAKLVSKIAKYPHVEDYHRTLTEMDEKGYICLKLLILQLRNQYVLLHDMIIKNIEKIKQPQSSEVEALY